MGVVTTATIYLKAQVDTLLSGKVASTLLGANNGVATLDGAGKVPVAQLPAVAISDFLGAVASQAAMLALTGQRGDWCTRTDLGADFILIADTPNLVGSWRQITSPGGVTSVAGRTGAIVLVTSDLTDAKASILTRWKANTAYVAATDFVLSPTGQVMKPVADFTSGATYSAVNWTPAVTAAMIPFSGVGIVAKNVQDAILEVYGYGDDAGDAWSLTTKTLSVTAGTYVTDADLNIPLAANQAAWIEYFLTFTGPTTSTANLRAQLLVPAGATGTWSSALDYDAAGSAGTAKGNLGDLTAVKTFKLNTGPTGVRILAKIANGTTGGNVSIQLSPDTTTASAVVRDALSRANYTKVMTA